MNLGYRYDGGVYPNLDASINDLKIYATALSDSDIATMYGMSTAINKEGNVFTNHISTPENLLLKHDKAINNKKDMDGVSYYNQTHCTCTFTDDGFRIVRTPDLVYPTAGNVMWGGLRLTIPQGTIKPDRKYKILFDYKGKSSQPFDMYFALTIGWSTVGGLKGLWPKFVNVPPSNYSNTSWKTAELSFSFTYDQIYQTATKTESICTAGTIYNCVNEFKIGYAYNSTGALGTDMYIKNIRLFDITDGDIGIQKYGIKASAINEVGITKGLIAYYPFDKDAKDYSGNNKHLTGSYVLAGGIKNQSVYITNALKTNLAFPASGTVSAWGKYSINNAQMLFSFNTDAIYGPNLYIAHETISWNTGNGGGNPFVKNGVAVTYPTVNEWHHYAVVINAELNKVTLYIDGEYAGDANYVSPSQPSTKSFVIGASKDETSYVWQGCIDNVKLSSHCWSSEEVKIEYETTAKNKVLINKDGTFYANSFDETLI